ncbi:MAG: hypothetical protein M3548_10420 [Actinomycetota bacterium]|nr:hypothetical protein [Actinomycetota bacterium]
MAAIRVDPDWVGGYAEKVAKGADDLAKGAETLRTAPLTSEAFGSLGRTVRVADAYGKASESLRAQLVRGVEALEAASASLLVVAEKYRTSDGDGAQTINRSGKD